MQNVSAGCTIYLVRVREILQQSDLERLFIRALPLLGASGKRTEAGLKDAALLIIMHYFM